MESFLKLVWVSALLLHCSGLANCQLIKIDGKLIKELRKVGKLDVLVNFVGDNSPVLKEINSKSFDTRVDKARALTDGLQQLANIQQAPVKNFLESQNIQYLSFWSSNQLVVRIAPLSLIQGLAAFKQVRIIQKLPKVKLEPITPNKVVPSVVTVQWGVAKIQADQVWSKYSRNGQDVVVANIDTGVLVTHEALAGNFRSDHGWFDPYNGTATPTDGNGHGTHTMGTICGAGGIGVAPGATWIACRGCGSSSCDSAQLLACGQFMLAPTNPDGTGADPSKIPDVVSNSWGSSVGSDTWYNATIQAWDTAGIHHAFAIGNSGPLCRSGGSPGDQPTTFSVGSTDSNDKLSSFSSKGPAGTGVQQYTKPDIVAPGSNIYSAWNTGNTSYNTISGTSMATPHVAGVIALMLSVYRNQQGVGAKLPTDKVVTTIEATADTQGLSLGFFNLPCGSFYNTNFPNNQFGYGRVNALKAVNATVNPPP